jgi:hypothetical protein
MDGIITAVAACSSALLALQDHVNSFQRLADEQLQQLKKSSMFHQSVGESKITVISTLFESKNSFWDHASQLNQQFFSLPEKRWGECDFEQRFPPTAKAAPIGYRNHELLIKHSRPRVMRRSSDHQIRQQRKCFDDPYNDLMRRSSIFDLNRVAPIIKSSKYLVIC